MRSKQPKRSKQSKQSNLHLFYTTLADIQIYVVKGEKSDYDFIVKYKESGKHVRTPKHIHIIIDLYMKQMGNYALTMDFVDHLIQIIQSVRSSTSNPPELQLFSREQIAQFQELDRYGEYTIEFLLVIIELIMIQEKTNYPNGTMNLNVFRRFRDGADIYTVVSMASFTNRKK